ncbi:protein-glutamate O-methyltransferase [uncultured Jannaschia sp.]|uniref:CheR family methyltransferase n=1 Tax=uncultured Jannaschia sp. TaxID=293347 RepID=UPI002624A362|nr:protein-glutamate O-methyltransferase [uncultured Jannaschia sp.]
MAATAVRGDYPFTDRDFRTIAALAHENFGLFLEPCKKQLAYSRLARRLRFLGLETFGEYCDMLRGPLGEDELREMLSALTTNVTQFFRERHHFDQLRAEILPELLRRAKAGRRVRLWSAGCSAGQEAYSLALTILELCPEVSKYDLRILATDIDPVILERAVQARYPLAEREAIPVGMRKTHTVTDGDSFVMSEAVRRLVSFGELNLMEPWPMTGRFDVIMCRNVAIYFDSATQARLWKRFADLLTADGQLMIGHSERLSGPAADELRNCGVTSYRKT